MITRFITIAFCLSLALVNSSNPPVQPELELLDPQPQDEHESSSDYQEYQEYTTIVSPTTGRTIEVITPVALILRNRTNFQVAELKSGSTTNHLNKSLPNSTKNITDRPRDTQSTTSTTTTTTTAPTTTTTSTTAAPSTTTTTTTTTAKPITTTTKKPLAPETKIDLQPRRVPSRGPHAHSCPRPEDIHPCECLEITNHYNLSQIETVSFCKNIRNSEVLKDAMKGMQGHFINYFVLDSCKLPPFPNGLFHNMGIGWMEVLNSTVQFQESFFTCSNGCW